MRNIVRFVGNYLLFSWNCCICENVEIVDLFVVIHVCRIACRKNSFANKKSLQRSKKLFAEVQNIALMII